RTVVDDDHLVLGVVDREEGPGRGGDDRFLVVDRGDDAHRDRQGRDALAVEALDPAARKSMAGLARRVDEHQKVGAVDRSQVEKAGDDDPLDACRQHVHPATRSSRAVEMLPAASERSNPRITSTAPSRANASLLSTIETAATRPL